MRIRSNSSHHLHRDPKLTRFVKRLRPLPLALLLCASSFAQTTTRVSVDSAWAQGNALSSLGSSNSISADGRYVAFLSAASNLVPNDNNGTYDIFVRDLQTGLTTLASVDSNGAQGNSLSSQPSISADGRYVAFESYASNLVPGDTNNRLDVFVHDRQSGVTSRVSVDSAGAQGNSDSVYGSISADGRHVAFISYASNLVPGDTNGVSDVFVHDLQSGVTSRVSVDSGGAQANNFSWNSSISADGRYVPFGSDASNLVPGDTNVTEDVFVHDLQTGLTTRVSLDSAGAEGNGGDSDFASITADGRHVAFASVASNLVSGDTNGVCDVFVHDLQTGATTRESVQGTDTDGASQGPSFSDGARYVAFWSNATNLTPGDTNNSADVFVSDLSTGATTRASVGSGGAEGNNWSSQGRVSSDGRYVAFLSQASNLVTGDTNGATDIFVRDATAGTTTRASVDVSGMQAPSGATYPSMSADGRYVAFESFDPLVSGDTNGMADIFVRDLVAGTTVRASVSSAGAQADVHSVWTSISADGRVVGFDSYATNLVAGDTNGLEDCFVRDLQTGTTTRVSVATGGAEANDQSFASTVSPDGRYVVFCSFATNLVPGDTNGMCDVFVRDLQSGTTTRESVGAGGVEAIHQSFYPSISRGGRYVTFASDAWNLVAGDTNGMRDVFLRDRLLGQTFRISVSTAGVQGDGNCCLSNAPAVSPDGRLVAFESLATNLVFGDANAASDVFLRDRGDEAVFAPFCFGDGTGAACPCGNSGSSGHGCQNSAGTGGAILSGSGTASLSADTAHLSSSGELPTSTSILLQGPTAISPANYGDGLRCTGGSLKRLYLHSAVGGSLTVPQGADLSISARSAALGAPIPVGAARFYQMYYRDPSATFCPNPPGNTFNMSNAIAIQWGP